MKEIELKNRKMYSIMLFFFRMMIIIFFSYQLYGAFWSKEIGSETLIGLAIMAMYLLGMMLLPIGRVSLYVETLATIFMTIYFNEPILTSLFVFPLAVSMVAKVEKVDMVSVPILLFIMLFYAFGWNPKIAAFSMGLFVFFFIKEYENIQKFDIEKNLRKTLSSKDKAIQELESEAMTKDKELEHVASLLIRLKSLNKKIEINALLEDMVSSPKLLFNAEYAALYAMDDNKYRLLKESGNNRRYEVPKTVTLSEGEEEVIENDFIKVPIKFENKPWGIIYVFGKREQIYQNGQKVFAKFNEDDFEKLAFYVEQVMFSMQHAKLLTQLEDMANNDFLTKIPNRRYFMEKFSYFIGRAKRGDELAVIVLDVDHFKKFNDTYGHDKGDEVLKIVAEVLTEYVREIDFVGRLGGEEFGVLIPNANSKAIDIAERLRKKISQVPFVQQITISLGIAYYGKDGVTADELYNNADSALYVAKETGRNKVCEYESK